MSAYCQKQTPDFSLLVKVFAFFVETANELVLEVSIRKVLVWTVLGLAYFLHEEFCFHEFRNPSLLTLLRFEFLLRLIFFMFNANE